MTAYLDNSATTQPSDAVIEAMTKCMKEGFYNPSSLYAPAIQAEKQMNRCRAMVTKAIHAPQPQAGGRNGQGSRLVFTSGGTEANNLAIMGTVAAMHGLQHIAVSSVEHPSILAAADALEAQGHKVTRLKVDHSGQLNWEELEDLLEKDPPALISAMQVNNETGARLNLERFSETCRRISPNTVLHVDGVQGFLRVPMDAKLVDMYTLSGHKIHGPKGTGALWIRDGIRVQPRQIGGGQEELYRSGTENTPGIAGLLAAVMTMPADAPEKMMALKLRLAQGLKQRIPEVIFNGPLPEDGAPHILNVSFPGVRGEVMLHALEAEGVYVSTGSACSSKKRKISPVLLAMGIPEDIAEGALRFSLSVFTQEAEIDYACEKAEALYAALKRFRRK